MSLQITGKAGVYKLNIQDKFVSASLRVAKKDKQGQWKDADWFNCKFVGKCKDEARKLVDKDKINLASAILDSNKGTDGKTYINIVVFEFTKEQAIGNQGASQPQDGFSPINDDSDELPF